MSERISILIVDDHTVVRQGVRAFLEVQPDFSIAGKLNQVSRQCSSRRN